MEEDMWTDKMLDIRLKDLFTQDEGKVSDSQWAYREAASVLAYFDLNNIEPVGGKKEGNRGASGEIGGDSELKLDLGHQNRWMLRAPVRREALTRLVKDNRVQQALDANPISDESVLQSMLEGYLLQRADPIEKQSLEQLNASLIVCDWLYGIVDDVPSLEKLGQRIERETLLAPFNYLIGGHFAGRVDELSKLSKYVGVRQQGVIESIVSINDKPPLFIHGVGGMGKSTLVAKFIIDHANVEEPLRFPFAYLDFDRPSLIAEEPITLLLETLYQLAIQYPDSRTRYEELRQNWTNRMSDKEFWEEQSQSSSRISYRLKDRDWYLESFSSFVNSLKVENQPLLLVLDTFEEVQFQSKALVEEVFTFLDMLQKYVPRLRTVLAGRALVQLSKYKTNNLPLGSFDLDAAKSFLIKQGIEDIELAAKVASQVGTSPLVLKLAASVWKKGRSAEGIKDLDTGFFSRLAGETIQQQLYTRILDHIHDKEVRKLAHPGLILRRITPELILEVLAGPCDVKVLDLESARGLFKKLSEEVTLVGPVSEEVLEHRPDLRSVMLGDLRCSKQKEVGQIHQNAVSYYEQKGNDPAARAEEFYHRLSLGLDREKLNERWMDGMLNYLRSSIQELPEEGQAYLAARFELEISEDIWKKAALDDWELHATQLAKASLQIGKPEEALAALRQRTERTPGSELYTLEVDALMRLGRLKEALDVAENGIASTAKLKGQEVDQRSPVLNRLYEQLNSLQWNEQSMSRSSSSKSVGPLKAAQRRALFEALSDAFTVKGLERLLLYGFKEDLYEIVPANSEFASMVLRVISYTEKKDRLEELIAHARDANPSNAKLFALAQQFGLVSTSMPSRELDKFIVETNASIDVDTFRARIAETEARVCRIEFASNRGRINATGFLVGPSVVMTNYHVMEPVINGQLDQISDERPTAAREDVVFSFDHSRSLKKTAPGTAYRLAEDWLIDSSPDSLDPVPSPDSLDYALLQLDGSPGDEDKAGGFKRGWIDITLESNGPANESPILIMQCPVQGPLKLAIDPAGIIGLNENGTRIRYSTTVEPGCSGSPCFNKNFEGIAMHSVGDPSFDSLNKPSDNQGIPFSSIVELLKLRNAMSKLG